MLFLHVVFWRLFEKVRDYRSKLTYLAVVSEDKLRVVKLAVHRLSSILVSADEETDVSSRQDVSNTHYLIEYLHVLAQKVYVNR